ncbi:HEPN domain-containing protein [Pseudomonas syringae pv. syringae]|uniref:hypothetical protein n=1 Tax=Pseudomonas syringae TaxID=317 RepID=UPI002E7B7236|nr:hypothetical protein [Pseudomonas syringae]MEE1990809.1 HEPN domain-containing protein [Pseudomonas syringae pv. syringae]MEE1996163.1 HEPN domain-containing protein [Pseudomonas syringae pv. syringae]
MWNTKLITTLRYINFTAPGTYEFMPCVTLIVGAKNISKYIGSDFKRYAGEIEYTHFVGSNNIVVGEVNDKSWGEGWENSTALDVLFCWLMWIEWILQDSWLAFDSCVHSEIAFAKRVVGRNYEWASNNLTYQASDSSGSRQSVATVGALEIHNWIERGLKIRTYIHQLGVTIGTPVISKKYARFARFAHFVQLGRKASHPAMKVAQMCSALESLFSTDTSELTHRLSERVAMFLGGDAEVMEKNYQMMKKCYAVRSQVTHGSHIKDGVAESIPDMSLEMLNMLRKIALKILDDKDLSNLFDGENEGIETYFRKLLFGVVRF